MLPSSLLLGKRAGRTGVPSNVVLSDAAERGVFGELEPPASVVAVPTIPGGNAGMAVFEAEVGVPLFIDVVLLCGGGDIPKPEAVLALSDDVLGAIAGLAVFMTLARSSYAVSRRKVNEGTDADVGVAKEEGAAPAYPTTDALLGVDWLALLLVALDECCDPSGEEADERDDGEWPTTALEFRR